MLSDNAAVFTGIPRRGGRVALEIELASLGISFRHSRPYHPQTCGKVERFHQTLKRWLVRQPDAPTLRTLQRQLDTFRDYYNTRRPHRALHRRSPAEAFTARPKAHPTGIGIHDGHWRIRHDRVHAGALIEAVVSTVAAQGGRELWLVTTNDNVDALRLYQRRGFHLARLDSGAIDRARDLKPTIPLLGRYGIPMRDELMLVRPLPYVAACTRSHYSGRGCLKSARYA